MESGQKARAEIHADCEADARAQVEKIWKDAGCDSATLSDDPNDASHNDRLEFESQVRQRADELAGEREDRIRQRADEIFREYVAAIVEKKVGEGAAMYWKAQGVDMTALDEAQKAELARQVDVAFKARVSGMETQARMETINAFASGNIDPANLSPMERAEFERQVQCAVDKLMADIAFAKNEVSSALGVRPRYIHINNTERGHAPIVLEAGDALLVASDGVTVPVCDHEYGISLFTACSGDMEAARNYILDVAEMRRKELHEPMCGCKPRKGRKDDMSLLFRYAEEAFPGADAYYNKACSLAWLGRRVAMQPKEYPVSKSFRMIMDGCRAGSMKPGRLMYLFDALMDGADEAPKGKRDDAYNAVIGTVFGIVSQRDDRDELIRMLTPKIGSWSGRIMRLLQESPEASPCERAMFDLVRQSVSTAELGGLLSARRSVIIGWAVEAMDAGAVHAGAADTGAERPDTTARGADAAAGGGAPVSGQAPQPIFHSQTDERGRPLDGSATRYLDAYLQGLSDSSIVQNVAARLGVLPRDLEIMVFQVYSDFRRDVAVNPHMSAEGQQLIAEVGDHLCTGDAERILMASYLIHRLMGRPADSVQAREMVEALHTTVEGMDPFATYPQRFNNKTYELRRGYDRGSDDS
jgi:hypothetical protein